MRETIVSILTILVIATPARCSDKDGFNFYKDYLRGRSDDGMAEGPGSERTFYFYRTPVQLYPGLLPALEQEYRKRTGNAFKNHMLSKELVWPEGEAPPSKRGSKTALALMLQGKHNSYHTPSPVDDLEVLSVD
ncbi:hypothetical protein O0L34_g17183 [Tuta absoluta]|nr:hypothetical protein O0L34_g17183 [Tuta absoluta]